MTYRICTKCGEEFEATTEFFHKEKNGKFGLTSKCRSCIKKYQKQYQKQWRIDNDEHIKQCGRQYRAENPEYIKKYRAENPDKFNANAAKRRAQKRNQTPYLTQDEKHQIEMIYKKSQELGPDWHVDHIRPLAKGGLHHPDNLQIVQKSYNLQKSNRLNFRLPTGEEIYKG